MVGGADLHQVRGKIRSQTEIEEEVFQAAAHEHGRYLPLLHGLVLTNQVYWQIGHKI